jgi:hypothetical protein
MMSSHSHAQGAMEVDFESLLLGALLSLENKGRHGKLWMTKVFSGSTDFKEGRWFRVSLKGSPYPGLNSPT